MKQGQGNGSSRVRNALMMGLALLSALGVPAAAAEGLPDGRAYELVSPSDTGSVYPTAFAFGQAEENCFAVRSSTLDGNQLAYLAGPGSMPGYPANGTADLYEATRGEDGWHSVAKSPSAQESEAPLPAFCPSEDHQFSTFLTGSYPLDRGTLVLEENPTSYLRTPQGEYQLVGIGSAGEERHANVKWIAPGGAHIIFTALEQLEPEAPTAVGPGISFRGASNPAVGAIYDRTPQGQQVVSLLPSGLAPNPATETTFFLGASRDGSVVAFEVVGAGGSTTLYLKREGQSTIPIVTGPNSGRFIYAGIADDGSRVAYLESEEPSGDRQWGNIYLYDPATETSTAVTSGGEAAIVNFSRDGSHLYFISEQALTGGQMNAYGATAKPGSPNLYVWDAAQETTRFIATVNVHDVDPSLNSKTEGAYAQSISLVEWTLATMAPQQTSQSSWSSTSARTTPDGSVLVFEARSNITGFDSSGRVEIYRYSASDDGLTCVSCPPNGTVPRGGAALVRVGKLQRILLNSVVDNLTSDGSAVFFVSPDRLSGEDTDKVDDVYEWRNGSQYLISEGNFEEGSYLYSMTPTGSDVFFTTGERLLPQDESSVESIYDARIGGGFPLPSPPPPSCEGEACQGPLAPQPAPAAPASAGFTGPANPKVKRHRKRHKKKHQHHHRRHRKHDLGQKEGG